MTAQNYIHQDVNHGVPLKMWVQGVPVDDLAKDQLILTARLPFIFKHIAVMPDVHAGKGSTIGSVIPTQGAIIPAAVGVDIGCGMMACKTSLTSEDLPPKLRQVRLAIEQAVPHGRKPGRRDPGAWHRPPEVVNRAWAELEPEFEAICAKYPHLERTNHHLHLGTLGTGNHFVELCLDENNQVWIMLHSGSRGVGNAIGTSFINLAREEAEKSNLELPHWDLAYFEEGTPYFHDYLQAANWAQKYAATNREIMMQHTLEALQDVINTPFEAYDAINCHHNYVDREQHFGQEVYVTRKGAVRAQQGETGIIPGSMGERSFIVQGKGHPDSFASCSHGAGRVMSRNAAKKTFSLEEHAKATAGVECRKDANVLDETPKAYKNIDAVMQAQTDLANIVHTLKQVVCVKG